MTLRALSFPLAGIDDTEHVDAIPKVLGFFKSSASSHSEGWWLGSLWTAYEPRAWEIGQAFCVLNH